MMMKRMRIERALREDAGRSWEMVLGEEFIMVLGAESRGVTSMGFGYVLGRMYVTL